MSGCDHREGPATSLDGGDIHAMGDASVAPDGEPPTW